MRLYTRRGDTGTTDLLGGPRVEKDHPRVEAYGAVDELNSALGLAAAAGPADWAETLRKLQSWLFDLGADLCAPEAGTARKHIRPVPQERVDTLERMIDETDGVLPRLTNFVLPGGTELAARLHHARTVGRRAERRLVHLAREETVNPRTVTFLNRLTDLLFSLARRANQRAGVGDVAWSPGD